MKSIHSFSKWAQGPLALEIQNHLCCWDSDFPAQLGHTESELPRESGLNQLSKCHQLILFVWKTMHKTLMSKSGAQKPAFLTRRPGINVNPWMLAVLNWIYLLSVIFISPEKKSWSTLWFSFFFFNVFYRSSSLTWQCSLPAFAAGSPLTLVAADVTVGAQGWDPEDLWRLG